MYQGHGLIVRKIVYMSASSSVANRHPAVLSVDAMAQCDVLIMTELVPDAPRSIEQSIGELFYQIGSVIKYLAAIPTL